MKTGLWTDWVKIAYQEYGVKEIKGGENPRIIEYHSITTLKATEDEVPWCASFVGWCLEKSGIKSTKSAAAKSYLQWGQKLEVPLMGAIVILTQGIHLTDESKQKAKLHVGFWVGSDRFAVHILGGNQADQVSERHYFKTQILDCRWPRLEESRLFQQ